MMNFTYHVGITHMCNYGIDHRDVIWTSVTLSKQYVKRLVYETNSHRYHKKNKCNIEVIIYHPSIVYEPRVLLPIPFKPKI